MEYFEGVSGENLSICGDGVHLPGEKFTAGLQGIYGCILDSAAAGDFHAHNGDAFNIVLADDLGKLFTVIHRVKFRTSDKGDLTFDKILVEVCIGIGCTVCCNEQVCSVEIWCVDRDELYLHRPLLKLGFWYG